MKDPKIYSIEDLINDDFDDEEIDIVSKSLIYSLIIGMFRHVKNNTEDKEIIKLIKMENWPDNYKWTEFQRNEYKKKLDKIFYNLYRFGPIKSSNTSNEFLMKYGFIVKPSQKKKIYNKNKKAQ
jgi:hypothetical protein